MKNLIEVTNGKKTTGTSFLMVAFQIFLLWKPDLLSDNMESTINMTISSGILASLLHKAWRNRKEIHTFILSKYKSIKNHLKK